MLVCFLLARWIEAAYIEKNVSSWISMTQVDREEEEVKQLLHSEEKGWIVSGALCMTQVDDEWHCHAQQHCDQVYMHACMHAFSPGPGFGLETVFWIRRNSRGYSYIIILIKHNLLFLYLPLSTYL